MMTEWRGRLMRCSQQDALGTDTDVFDELAAAVEPWVSLPRYVGVNPPHNTRPLYTCGGCLLHCHHRHHCHHPSSHYTQVT